MGELSEAATAIKRWREHPESMVRELFNVEPDAWQLEGLQNFPHDRKQAFKACKGPGKTALLAWYAWNFLLTRPHPKIAACSISADNLSDGLWTEMAKWQSVSPLLQKAFKWTKTRISSVEHEATWWMSARSWSRSASTEQQADTLAGLHADYLLFIIDEAGGVPDAVAVAAEAGLSTGVETKIVLCGNPTHLDGPLYRACTSARGSWRVIEITGDPDDPKRSQRIDINWAREQIAEYGADSPWVLVNVFGRFPPSSLNALLGPDEVKAAMGRHHDADVYEGLAKILGVDVAREGDDRSVIFPRQGLVATKPIILRNADSIQGAGHTAQKWVNFQADAAFVDNTGGFGAGWIDQLRVLGHTPTPIHFSGKANDPQYGNKRAEMFFLMAQWIKDGGALPDIPELVAELTTPVYYFHKDRLMLEEKDQIKARLGRSPDLADALALTFAQPVVPALTAFAHHNQQRHQARTEYDVLGD